MVMSNYEGEGLLVIDGDWLAYMIACTAETKSVKIYDSENNFVKEYKNKTAYMKDTKNYNESHTITPCQTLKPKYKSTTSLIMNKVVNKALTKTNCKDVLIALGGPTNFRDRLPLPRAYKGSRANVERPLVLSLMRTLIGTKYPTIYSEDEEADDIISKYQFQSFNNIQQYNNTFTNRVVVCTLDKDARGTPGLLYDPNKEVLTQIEGLGYLERKLSSNGKSRKLYGVGRKWFYSQLLTGDKADDYFPCDIYKTITNNTSNSPIITDLKCFNLLDPCTTDKECLQVIKDTYYGWYKDVTEWTAFNGNTVQGDWLDILQMYVDVVHMRRFDNDRVDVKNLLLSLGIINE